MRHGEVTTCPRSPKEGDGNRDGWTHDAETEKENSVQSIGHDQGVENAEARIEGDGDHADDSLLWDGRFIVVGGELTLGV
ncbi:hypothetical protein [Aeromicrobium sp.]|uniref:hypothetical protein n=1 Tax=Aeromicrobium sp. TaxID=1871063 RepID=UPI003C448C15